MLKPLEEWKERLDNNEIVGEILIDLSKIFDCVPYDILFGVDEA